MLTRLLVALLPAALRRRVRRLVEWPGRRQLFHRIGASSFRVPREQPALNYGLALPRRPGAIIHGGRVKLLALDQRFPEQARDFNVIYLVSSAIPPHASDLVCWSKKRGVKFVWNQNGVGYSGWAGRRFDEINVPMRRLLPQADFVIYQSEFCRDSADRFIAPASSDSAILFNPVDIQRFQPLAFSRETLRLLAIGTHSYRDRVLSVIQSLASVRDAGRDATLTVAGPLTWKNATDDVRQFARKLRVERWVHWRETFAREEAADIYRSHHILVHPKYLDPCPTVVIEAFACGLPVVGSASGGLPELVSPGCGMLIPVPLDWNRLFTPEPDAMASAILNIDADYESCSQRARQRAVESFDVNRWLDRHEAIFRDLIAR